jgi:predicted amidohydrolase YtcJ
MIFAFRFDENQVAERRFPFLSEMDQVCPDKPLLLRRIDGHSCVVNSFAQKQFFSAFPGLAAANIAANAAISGELNDLIVHWFHSNCSPQMIVAAYHQAAAIAAQNGHTSIHTMIGDAKDSITHYQLMRDHLADFPIEYILYPQSFNIAAALDAGATRIGGCILADGSLGSYTAALSRPYQDKQDEYGRLYQTDAFWDQFLTAATTAGLQVGIHCIGDRAIRQINDVYLRLQRKYQHDLRHEIIHAELTPDDLVAEIALSHAVCVMQPAFDQYWGGETGFYHRVLGRERALQMNRFHSLSQQGITVTGGSDWYITELDAIRGIIAALQHHNPQERLTPFQAISLYTKNAAWLAHDENRLGQLAPGYQADFVCLDADLMQPENAERAKVIATYKAGKCIYE